MIPKIFIANRLREYFIERLQEKNLRQEDRESFIRLRDLDIQRKMVKIPIMTKPYGSTAIRTIDKLKQLFEFDVEYTKLKNKIEDLSVLENTYYENIDENINNENMALRSLREKKASSSRKVFWYRYKQDANIKLENLDFINMYKAINYVLLNVFPALDILINYFKKVAKISGELGLYIPWKLPNGVIPHLSYMKLRNARLKPLNYSSKTFSFKVPIEGSYDKHKQIRAIMPNLVHSLDAACLSILINNYFNSYNIKIKNIYGVHDCFGVTANNVDFIINDLKTIYINIYSDNGYLVKFNNEIIHNIKLHYGEESFDDENLVIKFDRTTINYPDINKVIKGDFDIQSITSSFYTAH